MTELFQPRMNTDKHGCNRRAAFRPLQRPNAMWRKDAKVPRALKRRERRAPSASVSIRVHPWLPFISPA